MLLYTTLELECEAITVTGMVQRIIRTSLTISLVSQMFSLLISHPYFRGCQTLPAPMVHDDGIHQITVASGASVGSATAAVTRPV